MVMTNRGHTRLGGSRALLDPFMDNGTKQRVTISVDNRYNRGKIPAFSLWAPMDRASNPWKYMPYIPGIVIRASNDTDNYDIENAWGSYFRAGDEVISMDVSQYAAANLAFFGTQGQANDTDITTLTIGTNTAAIASVGVKDSGGTGLTRLTMTDMLDTDTKPAEGLLGTGDVLVLAGYSSTAEIKSYQQAANIVIMEQSFDFQDAITDTVGEGGYLVESCVYSYSGRIDQNYIEGFSQLNVTDASPALTVCTQYTNGTRFNFESVYRG